MPSRSARDRKPQRFLPSTMSRHLLSSRGIGLRCRACQTICLRAILYLCQRLVIMTCRRRAQQHLTVCHRMSNWIACGTSSAMTQRADLVGCFKEHRVCVSRGHLNELAASYRFEKFHTVSRFCESRFTVHQPRQSSAEHVVKVHSHPLRSLFNPSRSSAPLG